MRERDYMKRAEARVKRVTDETSATILRALDRGIASLQRERTEYLLRRQRKRKSSQERG